MSTNVTRWMWCSHCERCFEVMLAREPRAESPLAFGADPGTQMGADVGGTWYTVCPYDGCDGNLEDFWWWGSFKRVHSSRGSLPEIPAVDTVYPTSY